MTPLLFMLMIQGKRYVLYEENNKYVKAGGPYNSREAAFAGMATIRGQWSEEDGDDVE